MVKTDIGFRLSAYLENLSCSVTLASGERVKFEEWAYSDGTICKREMKTMIHDFWASAVTDMPTIRNQTGLLRIDYCLRFTGHEKPDFFEVVVPVVKRTTRYAL